MGEFTLLDSFIEQYKGKQPDWGPIGYVTFKRTYARPIPDEKRTEEFWETVKRVVEGTYSIQKSYCESLKLPWNGKKAQYSAQEMFRLMWEMKFLPPGRGLWMMGTDYVRRRGGAALNNCLGPEVKFFEQSKGLVALGDVVGQRLTIWTQEGWKPAVAKSYGEQILNEVVLKPCVTSNSKTQHRIRVRATSNHGWYLSNGIKTHNLRIGDEIHALAVEPTWDGDHIERTGKQHGYIFADGTKGWQGPYDTRYSIRLCGKKAEKVKYFEDITYPDHANGDPVGRVNSPRDLKALPWKEKPAYIAAFLQAWIEFDGHENNANGITLDTIADNATEFVEQHAPLIGYIVTGVSLETRDTNYGPRSKPLQRIKLQKTDKVKFRVQDILYGETPEEVFCLEVPDLHEFTLAGGIHSLNCAFVSTKEINIDFAEPFCFLMDMSMLGVGVGGDTKGAGILRIKEPRVGDYTFTVEDSREGWVAIARCVMDAYAGKGSLPKKIDYSKVRPYGEPIKSFGGTASGPGPLSQLVEEDIHEILHPLVDDPITSEAIVDLFNAIGRCVVSGNVRRSAEIMLGDPEDGEFLELKNPETSKIHAQRCDMEEGWRWASNNSLLAEIGMDYGNLAERTAQNGEPGYFWLDTARKFGRLADPATNRDKLAEGCNPCGEQTLESYELCCLVETFPARHDSFDEYERTLKFAYLYAKTVTLVPTHNPRTNAVMLRNRRIGTSQSGIVQSFVKHGIREHYRWCDEGYQYLRSLDRIYSDWLCIPPSRKITSVKPSGTVSLLPGSTPGVHFPYAEHYWRTIRMDEGSELVEALRKAGYRVEKAEGHNTVAVYFPVKEKNFFKSRADVTIWEQLEIVAQMQFWWADNQVSVTVTFKPEEAGQIKQALELYETRLKSVSFLPLMKHKYKHAPYQPMTKEEYERAIKQLKKIKLSKLTETNGFENKYCDSDRCEIPVPSQG
jgi:ribonucleotide reductase alpha subunit